MDDYCILRQLGEGTFGSVYEARHRATQRTVAVKLVPLTGGQDSSADGDLVAANRELSALQLCQHPNVVGLRAHFVHRRALALVMDRLQCDLAALLRCCQRRATPLPLRATRLIARQLLTAVAHLHWLGVLHRDVKPANVLLAAAASPDSAAVRLADFGQARTAPIGADRPLSAAVSTRWFKAPELLLPSAGCDGLSYGAAVDVWAAGCVLAECASGAALLAGHSDVDQLSRVAALCGRRGGEQGWEAVDGEHGASAVLGEAEECGDEDEAEQRRAMLDLLDRMLQWDPAERITARQALDHPFLTRAATASEPASMDALLQWLDQTEAEQAGPPMTTAAMLQRPLTIGDIFSDKALRRSATSAAVR